MPASQPTVLLIGLGHLGGVLLEALARADWIGHLVAWSRNAERGAARCNLARLGAIAQGCSPSLEFRAIDLARIEACAEALDELQPDLVLATASLQTWWLPELLPTAPRQALASARFGVWLPFHLTPMHWLMEAVRQSSFRGPVVTAPFPDVVNCILHRLGLTPTCGTGNLDEIVAKVRLLAARRLQTPVDSVRVFMVGHHALERQAFAGRVDPSPPWLLQIFHHEHDVTEALGAEEILFTPHPLPPGPAIAFLTAGSSYRLVRALLSGERTHLHVPAPRGLPGGYPVIVDAARIELELPGGVDQERAVAINEQSHPFDGIDSIEPDGTVVYRPESSDIMRRELGYDCARLAPTEAAGRAAELASRFREYARRHGLDLDRLV